VNFFVVIIIDIHQLNLRPSRGLEFLVENSLKMCVFFIFFNNNGKIFYAFGKKKTQNQMEKKKIL
jgi:hypothetical protein